MSRASVSAASCLRWLGVSLPALALFAGSLVPAHAAASRIAPSAQKQIAEVIAFKRGFTEAEKKMSFNLVLLSREAHGAKLGTLARFVDRGVVDGTGKVLVDLHADLSPSLMTNSIIAAGERTDASAPGQRVLGTDRLLTHVGASDLLALAAHPDVHSVSEAPRATTNIGSVTSQGYIAHTANKAVALGVNGASVNVGVLSDSASPARVSALMASGDLPANVTVLPGQTGSGADEGTAMMEIIHDLAPGANLYFATAFSGQAQFAANIRALRFTYHCDVIVDDVSYFNEGVFQDGPIAQAVNDVVADGAIYFSSAANSGNLTSGTSGTYEGDFKSGGDGGPFDTVEGQPVLINDFGIGSPQLSDPLISTGGSGVTLKWSDPLGASSNDYDLFILDSTGTTLKGASGAAQTGTQDPYEAIINGSNCGTAKASGYCPAVGDQIVVILYQGAPRALHIDTLRGELGIATAGSTYGHNAAKSTFTLAATYWNSARTGVKPFTGAANPIETFSSDGPRKLFYNPDGSAITPGNVLFATSGGVTLQKPEATAADGVYTKTPGFLPFFGTSAAAPHAAAIAALVKSAHPSLTNVQIRQILLNTSLDNMETGVDRDGGYGVLTALPAVKAAQAVTP